MYGYADNTLRDRLTVISGVYTATYHNQLSTANATSAALPKQIKYAIPAAVAIAPKQVTCVSLRRLAGKGRLAVRDILASA